MRFIRGIAMVAYFSFGGLFPYLVIKVFIINFGKEIQHVLVLVLRGS